MARDFYGRREQLEQLRQPLTRGCPSSIGTATRREYSAPSGPSCWRRSSSGAPRALRRRPRVPRPRPRLQAPADHRLRPPGQSGHQRTGCGLPEDLDGEVWAHRAAPADLREPARQEGAVLHHRQLPRRLARRPQDPGRLPELPAGPSNASPSPRGSPPTYEPSSPARVSSRRTSSTCSAHSAGPRSRGRRGSEKTPPNRGTQEGPLQERASRWAILDLNQ